MKVRELLDGIAKQDFVLPEFQREYVWSRDQAKQLIVSLLREYPVGSLLFWKTDNPPELKNVKKLPDKVGTTQVILDGQQRLTTLHMLVTGNVPRYYKEDDIQMDPRDLYYNIETGDVQYYQPSKMKGSAVWKSVVDCFDDNSINVFEIAKKNSDGDEDALKKAQLFNDNINRLKNIGNIDFSIQLVPPGAKLGEAIDIFDRVNSQGTKLTDAELALTHITGKWAEARRLMKEKIAELEKLEFYFDLNFMTRALTGVATNRALFPTIHDRPAEELKAGWGTLQKILDYLMNVLPGKCFIHSTNDLNTTNILIPLVVFLARSGGKFPNEPTLKRGVHWLYAAQAWARYSGQTDQRMEHDVSLVVRHDAPWEQLCDQIIDQRGRIEVKGNDLQGRGVTHPLYRMSLIIAKLHGAVDWFNGIVLGPGKTTNYRIHSHHIFPQSILYSGKYDSDNHLHRKIINEIANRAFLTAETNLAISAKPPEEYLPKVEGNYPGALVKQFIPMDPVLWKVENFEDFLEERRNLIARKTNEFMSSLITEPEATKKRPLIEIIGLGESTTLEFKSTLQWDMVNSQINKILRHSVLKTVSAFLNSNGGTLVIGVEDDGNVIGLDNDLKTMGGSTDKFSQTLASLISDQIGAQYAGFVKIFFETIEQKAVCVVEVEKASEPSFLKGTKGKEFYVRLGTTSRMLDSEETFSYIQMNW